MSIPVVQNPHWAAKWSMNARCSGWRPSAPGSESAVSTERPSQVAASVMQARRGSPSTTTVQAPQVPCRQPCLIESDVEPVAQQREQRFVAGDQLGAIHAVQPEFKGRVGHRLSSGRIVSGTVGDRTNAGRAVNQGVERRVRHRPARQAPPSRRRERCTGRTSRLLPRGRDGVGGRRAAVGRYRNRGIDGRCAPASGFPAPVRPQHGAHRSRRHVRVRDSHSREPSRRILQPCRDGEQ